MKTFDILIIGGGLVGGALAQSLKDLNLQIGLIEPNQLSDMGEIGFDARSLALSLKSKRILKNLGLWQKLSAYATPMHTIHVSDKGHFGRTLLKASQLQTEALGYILELYHINQVLLEALKKQENLTLFSPYQLSALKKDLSSGNMSATIASTQEYKTLKAKLIIAADGTNSFVRKTLGLDKSLNIKEYNQQAIVTNIGLNRPHQNIAYERFSEKGPIALLPMSENRASLVWTLTPSVAKKTTALSEKEFLSALQHAFGYRLGRFIKTGKRVCFPLTLKSMPTLYDEQVLFIGNAAHTIHPVAGQGFNLGLRDIDLFAQLLSDFLSEAPLNQQQIAKLLKDYNQKRQQDITHTINFTERLLSVFSAKSAPITMGRNLGLLLLDNAAILKTMFIKKASGF